MKPEKKVFVQPFLAVSLSAWTHWQILFIFDGQKSHQVLKWCRLQFSIKWNTSLTLLCHHLDNVKMSITMSVFDSGMPRWVMYWLTEMPTWRTHGSTWTVKATSFEKDLRFFVHKRRINGPKSGVEQGLDVNTWVFVRSSCSYCSFTFVPYNIIVGPLRKCKGLMRHGSVVELWKEFTSFELKDSEGSRWLINESHQVRKEHLSN